MLSELAIRFVLGGLIVSAFAVIGDMLHPKSFAGIFGAAPSVALASLALAFLTKGVQHASVDGHASFHVQSSSGSAQSFRIVASTPARSSAGTSSARCARQPTKPSGRTSTAPSGSTP